jgi:tetrahydromethanopterin S-methyltransferase subunit A
MLKYNDLYQKIKEDQEADYGAYDSECMIHCAEKTKTKNKRKGRHSNSHQLQNLTVSDDLGDLWGALDSNNGVAGRGTVATV